MSSTKSDLSRRFAKRISEEFRSGPFLKALQKAHPQSEQKDLAKPIERFLEEFRTAAHVKSLPKSRFDWEGNQHRESKQERSYEIFGTNAWPDAAVLDPFKCAFEFDREPDQGRVHFKRQLMKASVHILSGAYPACVFVYLLSRGSTPKDYLRPDPEDVYSTTLIKKLEDAGLYVCLIPNRAA